MKKQWMTLITICFVLLFTGLPVFAQQETETAGSSLGKEIYEISPYEISLCSEGWEEKEDGKWKYRDSDGEYATSAWRKINGKWHWLDFYGWWVDDQLYRDYVDPAIKGIDVSRYQGDIDWQLVKEDGVEFAIIKIGGNSRVIDPKYEDNIKAANKAGVPVGVYFYSKAQSVNDAILDAQFVIENITGHTISYPVVIDVEDSCQQDLGKEKLGRIAKAFCDEIRAAGYTPMIYTNENWYKNYIDMSQLEGVEKWIARYNYFYDTNILRGIWQSSSNGRVAGISGAVDINFGYTDYTEIITPRTAPDVNYKMTEGEWKYSSKGWWYSYYKGGYPANGWKQINGQWYWFDTSGYMKTGWMNLNDQWYYLRADGAMVTGWQRIGGSWYYFNSSGAMLSDQWVGDYYLRADGAMVTGWLNLDGQWYYLNPSSGAMVTGWLCTGGAWYYLSSSGVMVTGWFYDGKDWYYLRNDGKMITGKVEIDGKLNFFNNSGVWLGYL